MIDLEKLTPAPWNVGPYDEEFPDGMQCVRASDGPVGGHTDLSFTALARNAFDVMMRRGWQPRRSKETGKWFVDLWHHSNVIPPDDGFPAHADPFTALVESDKWYRANKEKT